MREIIVTNREAGQRLDKLLSRYLANAPASFLYKMMRKKNITLNGKKATGRELLADGDAVRIFFSDETYEKFAGKAAEQYETFAGDPANAAVRPLPKEQIIYEDEHVLIADKPAGVLSQKSCPTDSSINEQILAYLLCENKLSAQEMARVRPSVCNRLDRNTSGLIAAGKTLPGLQTLSELFRSRELHKYYLCLVQGRMTGTQRLKGYLTKDARSNRVTITEHKTETSKPVETQYRVVENGRDTTLLEVLLVTGRSHQIRAHLAGIGHPILGDVKYGGPVYGGIKHQLLHASRMEFPQIGGTLSYLSGRVFEAPLPQIYGRILKEY